MSKINLSGNALGSGTITIAAPNTNSNATLTLPTASGTVVTTGGAQTIEFAAGTAGAPSITTTGDTNTGIFFPAADTIAFSEGGAEAMRIDSGGNLGLGAVPEAWGGTNWLQLKNGIGNASVGSFDLYANSYLNTSFLEIYGQTGEASKYTQYQGQHRWSTAPSGTAGNNITFTERMRIDSSGNVGIGTTSPAAKLHVNQTNDALPALQLQHNDGDFILMEEGGGTDIFKFTRVASTNDLQVNVVTSANLRFATNNTERARITSDGNFQIPLTKLRDSSNEQYFVSYFENYGNAVSCIRKTGNLGVTGDPAAGYVILCKAYVSTAKDKDMAFGRVYRMRGSPFAGIINTVYEFMVGSAYQSNTGSGFYSGTNQSGSIVTLTYSGERYIALLMGSTSAGSVVADIWYGAAAGTPATPILVDPGSVSSVTTITSMTYV